MSKLNKYFIYFIYLTPILWILFYFIGEPSLKRLESHNQSQLSRLEKKIEAFKQRHARLPETLAALRSRAKLQWSELYDPWSERYHYEKLNDKFFFIKSFGEDRSVNLLDKDHDSSRFSLDEIYPTNYTLDSVISLYPAFLLDSYASIDERLHAKLYLDTKKQTKKLIVRSFEQPQFILTGFHDRVDEFFWLPSNQHIIFSASKSQRYEDGLYIWDLKTNRYTNVIDQLKKELSVSKELLISLSAVDGNRVFIFAKKDNYSPLDPSSFFHTRNMYSIDFNDTSYENFKISSYKDLDKSLFEQAPDHRLINTKELSPLQDAWFQLSTQGPIGGVLEGWQSFCADHSEEAIFSYCLWWLSSIYKDSAELLSNRSENEAEVIKNFGAEISQALIRYPLAPAHIRAMAEYINESLLEGTDPSYHVSTLEP